MTKDEALKMALEALEANQPVNYCMNNNGEKFPMMQEDPFRFERNTKAITAIKAALLSRSDGEAKDEKQKPVNIKKVAEEHGINLPTEFVPKHDESKAAIQSLTDQCAALIWERDELQKQMWRSEKQEPVALETVYETIIQWDEGGGKRSRRELARRIVSLYTTPPQRKPLTDEEINRIAKNYALSNPTTPLHFARAIEAAHGIKGET